jgi:hypothetical protein
VIAFFSSSDISRGIDLFLARSKAILSFLCNSALFVKTFGVGTNKRDCFLATSRGAFELRVCCTSDARKDLFGEGESLEVAGEVAGEKTISGIPSSSGSGSGGTAGAKATGFKLMVTLCGLSLQAT